MSDWITIDDAVLDRLYRSIGTKEQTANIVGDVANYWVQEFYQGLQENIKGKVQVSVSPFSSDEYLITVTDKGGEASQLTANKTTFIPESKMGAGGMSKPLKVTKEGDIGIFTRVNKTGRPSIQLYAESVAKERGIIVTEKTITYFINKVSSYQEKVFKDNNVTMTVGGYRAPAGGFIHPFTGSYYAGGQFVKVF